jgi:hypothetical protein
MEVRDGYRTSTATGALPSAVLTVRIPVAHSQLLVSVSLQQSSNCHSILSQFCSNWTALREHCCRLILGLFPLSLAFTSSSEMLTLRTRLKSAIPLMATFLLSLPLAPDFIHAIFSIALLFQIRSLKVLPQVVSFVICLPPGRGAGHCNNSCSICIGSHLGSAGCSRGSIRVLPVCSYGMCKETGDPPKPNNDVTKGKLVTYEGKQKQKQVQ